MTSTITYLILVAHQDSYQFISFNSMEALNREKTVAYLQDHATEELKKHLRRARYEIDEVLVYKFIKPFAHQPLDELTIAEIENLVKAVNSQYLKENATLPGGGVRLAHTASDKLVVVFYIRSAPEALSPVDEHPEDHPIARESIVLAARKRESPSSGAAASSLRTTQDIDRPDAVYNGRPLELSGASIRIYHPVFAKFLSRVTTSSRDRELTTPERVNAHAFVRASTIHYASEADRLDVISAFLRIAIDDGVFRESTITVNSKTIKPDGIVEVLSSLPTGQVALQAYPLLFEAKNDIGEGGSDPIAQAGCAYVAVCASSKYDILRQVSCCPAFLLGIAGPRLIISGAVFADQFIVQELVSYTTLGSYECIGRSGLSDSIERAALLLSALREGVKELRDYYNELLPSVSRLLKQPAAASFATNVFPYFTQYSSDTGDQVTLVYIRRLASDYPDKAIFLADLKVKTEGIYDESSSARVVVKFTHAYCKEAHELLAAMSPALAPKLWHCKFEESVQLYVVIMDFVRGSTAGSGMGIQDQTYISSLRTAMQVLHKHDWVFGDLRGPNVFITTTGINLIDFDWCGREGEARYPWDITLDSEDIHWHHDVSPDGIIKKVHDEHMFTVLTGEEL